MSELSRLNPAAWHVYALGSNSCGQLGVQHTHDISQPEECAISGRADLTEAHLPVAFACGGNHTLMLCHNGVLYATGKDVLNDNGTVITSHTAFRLICCGVDDRPGMRSRFKLVAATWEASFLVSKNGDEVYVWGKGDRGTLGLGEGVVQTEGLVRMEGFPPQGAVIDKIKAGLRHVVVLMKSGEVWGWGASRHGELGGWPNILENVWRPVKIVVENGLKVRDITCGSDFTVVKISEDSGNDRVIILRLSRHLPDWDNQENFDSIRQMSAGWASLYILHKDDQLEEFGSNKQNQILGNAPRLLEIRAGSAHCLGLTDSQEVIAWGWGEHGNCGTDVNENGCVAGRFNTIPIELGSYDYISTFEAGYATSFIVVQRPPRQQVLMIPPLPIDDDQSGMGRPPLTPPSEDD